MFLGVSHWNDFVYSRLKRSFKDQIRLSFASELYYVQPQKCKTEHRGLLKEYFP